MRSVLASLAVIAKKDDDGKKTKGDEASSSTAPVVDKILDKEAMYAQMRSSKTMKRKWKDSGLKEKKPLPKAAEEEDVSHCYDDSSDDEEDYSY